MKDEFGDTIRQRIQELRQSADVLTRNAGTNLLDDNTRRRLMAQVEFRLAEEYEWLLSAMKFQRE